MFEFAERLLCRIKWPQHTASLEIVKGLLHHPLPGIGIVPLLILRDVLARHQENHLVVLDHFQFLTSIKTETLESLGRKGDLMPRADLDAGHGCSPVCVN